MSIVCLDTQIIQWGVMRRAHDQIAEQFIKRAIEFVKWLEEQKHEIILPSIIVGELLVPIPKSEHGKILTLLSRDWMIVDYDLNAAVKFAELRADRAIAQIMQDIRDQNPHATRRQLHADVMIIATAIAHGAEKLYSHNKDFLKLAQNHIVAQNFLDIPIQSTFISDSDPESSD